MEEISPKIKRLIDANFNRLREGLRVVEDVMRFVFDDRELTEKLKNLRSDVGKLQREYDFLLYRDTPNDEGTKLSSQIEKTRVNLKDIVFANLKRAEESERVLEEIFKLINEETAGKLKAIRYKTYTLEKEIGEKWTEK